SLFMLPPPPRSTLFPDTTLFRSRPNIQPSDDVFAQMEAVFAQGDVSGTPETTTGPMPVVSFDQASTPSLLKPIQAFKWIIEYGGDRKSTRLNSSHRTISYAVFCL